MSNYDIKTNFVPLKVSGTTWVASDTHLGADSPNTNQAFIYYLNHAAENCDNLFLVGDIFDAWFGDDLAIDYPPEWLTPILESLKQTASKINLYIGTGNRDFLISKRLCDFLGATLLSDQILLQTDNHSFLLSHGDEYCTSDTNYQRYRKITRNRFIQKLFLMLSLKTRSKIAAYARKTSKKANKNKTYEILDVNQNTIEYVFKKHDVSYMIHGHTHRPNIHETTINNKDRKRIVLPDWDFESKPARAGYLIIDKDLVSLNQDANYLSFSNL